MIEKKFVSGGRCVNCGHGMIFSYEERIEGLFHLGDLVCVACGVSQFQRCLDVKLPEVAPDFGPLFGGAK
jgi:hypothetical protein